MRAMDKKIILAALPLVLMIALPARAQDSSPGVGDSVYVAGEYRVFTGAGKPASIDDIIAAMGRHQVVFVGEAHDPALDTLQPESPRDLADDGPAYL